MRSVLDHVDPFIGSATNNDSLGQGNTFPGATTPFGMLTFSPTTVSRWHGGDFAFNDETLLGFSLTHLSGAGCDGFGDLPILPTVGPLTGDPGQATTAISVATEQASPGYYAIRTGENVGVRLTATARTGRTEFTFPAGAGGNVLFKVAGSQRPAIGAHVEFRNDRELQGYVDSNGFCGTNGAYRLYFAARLDTAPTAHGTWQHALVGNDLLPAAAGALKWTPAALGGPASGKVSSTTGPGGQSAVHYVVDSAANQEWIRADGSGIVASQAYQAQVTVTGTGTVYLQFNNGSATAASNKIVLSDQPQTLTVSSTAPVGARSICYVTLRNGAAGHLDVTGWDLSVQQTSIEIDPAAEEATGQQIGGFASFDTSKARRVGLQVAISYVDYAGAWANLAAEQPSRSSFDAVLAATQRAWRDVLSSIDVRGGTDDELTAFYTALYHVFLHPSICSDVDGRYLGFDGTPQRIKHGQRAQYTNVSGWDVYRCHTALLALLRPKETSDIVQSLVNMAEQGGWLPKWPFANLYSDTMNGDPSLPIIAEAYAKGARDFDTQAALAAIVRNAEHVPTTAELGQGWYAARPHLAEYLANGWTPNVDKTSISPVNNGASLTLEYAVADFAGGQFARMIGADDVAKRLGTRGHNWRTLLNPATRYLQPRDPSGAFPVGDPLSVGMDPAHGQDGFQEGNAAQYNWLVPQDLPGLVASIGGRTATVERLQTFFTRLNAGGAQPYMWIGNEVCFLAPWVANSAGAPWLTQQIVRRIMTGLFLSTVDGIPGNDDLGATSAWYVWAALGLYPQTPGTPLLAVAAPLFPNITVQLGSGGRWEISAPAARADRPYVRRLAVNGRPVDRPWLTLDAIPQATRGQVVPIDRRVTHLEFQVSDRPDRDWGAAPGDVPPSGLDLATS
jgi:predicted alpha-1,2-mannosidase